MTGTRAALAAGLLLVALAGCSGKDSANTVLADSSGAAEWHDPSPHRVSMVTVSPGVQLEVLDWDGRGTPLVFLSGLGDTGHEFDDFAPRFADSFHVVGMTRRGYGASSQPATGYDNDTRVADLKAVLDSLGLDRVVLVGHSIAGDELTGFALKYPDRTAGLIYLDAAYDHTGIDTMTVRYPPPDPPPVSAADSASPTAWTARTRLLRGVPITEADVRANTVFAPDGRILRDVTPDSIMMMVIHQAAHPDYRKIRAPALAIYAIIDSASLMIPWQSSLSDSAQALSDTLAAHLRTWEQAGRDQFRHQIENGKVLELHGGNHYIFMSNEAQVEGAMREFLAGLARK